jgi:hypothetical protein
MFKRPTINDEHTLNAETVAELNNVWYVIRRVHRQMSDGEMMIRFEYACLFYAVDHGYKPSSATDAVRYFCMSKRDDRAHTMSVWMNADLEEIVVYAAVRLSGVDVSGITEVP